MVHALKEIRRVLVVGGVLIDLRPLSDRWRVEVTSSRGVQEAGRVTDLPESLASDTAANNSMAEGERAGLFRREREQTFPLRYSWDSPKEMQEYINDEWADVAVVDEGVWRQIRSLWAVANAEARVEIVANMLITRWARVG